MSPAFGLFLLAICSGIGLGYCTSHLLRAGIIHLLKNALLTHTSSTAGSGGGSYVSKDKSLDATPSPDAPRTLHLHVGNSQENVTDGGDQHRRATDECITL